MDKSLYFNLDKDGIINYFKEERDETAQLEFKSGAADLNKIYKELAAFANTDGGILIYGSPKEKEQKVKGAANRRYCVGDIIPSTLTKTEDDILSAVQSNITPTPPNISVKRIKLDEGCVYIFHVPKSNNKPHQHKGAYYIRQNTMSLPAEHGIVEMMFKQVMDVDLKVAVSIVNPSKKRDCFDIRIAINNTTRIPAQKVELFFDIIGNVHQVEDDRLEESLGEDYIIGKLVLDNGYIYLSKTIDFPHAIINTIQHWYKIRNLMLHDDYCYLGITYWAENVPAKTTYYKIFKDISLVPKELDLENDTTERQEYQKWRGKE